MRIAVIGSGHIGGTLGRLWARAGHDVCFGSRHADELRQRLRTQGVSAEVRDVVSAADAGDVIFTAVPYGVWPDLASEIGPAATGRIIVDAGNPYPQRDGAFAEAAIAAGEGAGLPVARLLPGVRFVRGFSSVFWRTLESEAHRDGDRVGIPLAGDDDEALDVAARLVRDAGFDPVVVGPLRRARDFDPGTRVYNTGMTAAQLRAVVGVRSRA